MITGYIGVYGFNLAELPGYTRMFGHVFTPQITMIFAFKTVLFSLAIALIPMAEGLYLEANSDNLGQPLQQGSQQISQQGSQQGSQLDSQLGGLARMFAVLLLIEAASLVGNYY